MWTDRGACWERELMHCTAQPTVQQLICGDACESQAGWCHMLVGLGVCYRICDLEELAFYNQTLILRPIVQVCNLSVGLIRDCSHQ